MLYRNKNLSLAPDLPLGLAHGKIINKKKKTFIERREVGEKGRERNIDVRGEHWSAVAPTRPDWGPNLQPRRVP